MSGILQLISPGSPLREGIENVLRANTGGLIVVGCNDKVRSIVDGGFQIHCSFTPSNLYELAKMDGAIVLNETGTKILIANAQLVPDSSIPSSETGMRHRTAERVAKETRALVIAISQRRNVITLYQNHYRYALKDMSVILTKANQALQTLEKYKVVMDQAIANFSLLEFEELVTFQELLQVLHRFGMLMRIKKELQLYLHELGVEGRLVRLQMKELLTDLETEMLLLCKDYMADKGLKAQGSLERFKDISKTEVFDDSFFLKALGFVGHPQLDDALLPRGYRILNKVPRIPPTVVENLISRFHTLSHVLQASEAELDEVDGIGEIRARKIKEGLKLIREQLLADRQL
ncbi:DNA integrity scanning diadenylate cyclase DisA [Bacillus fonticola]|uniref:DNA integrity scanning diadenylate cyclase DisA n=1 Tax=Bacillus fonticola TaxID=2728853 RepID=UPI0014763768|nr:DNA integrity scanning diadenylate cyclase DisA [Bacillus fonticola]